ncbi:MAG: hypothetical protein HC763_12040 [Hydrococcus sp. CRU_1_1]|nr:hypothetical protein [Hydrococcus sp. CRU_1_1]
MTWEKEEGDRLISQRIGELCKNITRKKFCDREATWLGNRLSRKRTAKSPQTRVSQHPHSR